MAENDPTDLEGLLDRIVEAADRDRVSVNMLLDAVGRRSFGPILLLAGIITLAPIIGDIPGVPTIMGVLVLLTGAQLVLGRRAFWLPAVLLDRSLARDKVHRAVSWLRRPARWIDHVVRPRLPMFVRGPANHVIALICIVIALAMPPMELVPFSANGAGLALTLFGLAIIGRDGLLALLAGAATVATFWTVLWLLL